MTNENRDAFKTDTTRVKNSPLPDASKIKSDATEVIEKAKNAGIEQFESGKQTAADQAQKVAAVVEQASSKFRENDLQTLAEYTSEIGTTIKNFSENFRNRSVEDLMNDTRALAKQNPTLFVLGSIAVGVAIGRFFKASAEARPNSYNDRHSHEASSRQYDNIEPMSLTDF
jgi:hypothetical protein